MKAFAKIVPIAAIVWLTTICYAQTTPVATIVPGSYVAGNASVAYTAEWQPFQNPAALACEKQFGLTLLYENRYITAELSNAAFSAAFPTKYINVGAQFSYFGYAEYNEMLAAVTFARTFGEIFHVGVECDYYAVYLSPTERYHSTATVQVGLQVQVLPTLTIGFNVFNPVFSKVKTKLTEKRLPAIFSLGTNYRIHDKVSWLVQIDKEVHSPMRWATGFEYAPFDVFDVRIGCYGSNYVVPTLGVGVGFGGFKFHLHCEYRNPLGVTMLGVLQYRFKQ